MRAVIAMVVLAGCGATTGDTARATDRCGIPPGLTVEALPPRERGLVARRLLACQDLIHGRIDLAEYRLRTGEIDRVLGLRAPSVGTDDALDAGDTQWASDVVGVSSEYSKDAWSAARALGAPDVFPSYGDLGDAWASAGADDREEWIELGFEQPIRVGAIDIIETYNPGAVDRIDVIDRRGAATLAWVGTAAAAGQTARRNRIRIACTREPVAAVRVHLDSVAVPGWNELDAVGVLPCK